MVTVCHSCGDRGFSNALLDCSKCSDTVVHQYCLGIPPGSIDDNFIWLCENCCEAVECHPFTSLTIRDVSTKRSEEACGVHAEDMNGVNRKMKNINSLYSKSITHNRKIKKQKRKRASYIQNTEKAFTLGSQCKKVKRLEDQAMSIVKADDLSEHRTTNVPPTENMELVLVEEQPEPLITLMPKEYEGSSEKEEISYGSFRTDPISIGHSLFCKIEPEEPVSSIMDFPREITRDLVLLVSPSGEIYIEYPSFIDELLYSKSLTTSILSLTSSFNGTSSDGFLEIEKNAQSCNSEETVVVDEPSLNVDEVGCFSEISKADALMEDQFPKIHITKQQQKNQSWEGTLHLKQENLARFQEEIVELEGELKSTKEHRQELECKLDNIRSLSSRFHGESLVDGLF